MLVPQWGDGNVARLQELAVTLVNAGVDIILAEGVTTVRGCVGRDGHHSNRCDDGR